jgi:hypothetical protein
VGQAREGRQKDPERSLDAVQREDPKQRCWVLQVLKQGHVSEFVFFFKVELPHRGVNGQANPAGHVLSGLLRCSAARRTRRRNWSMYLAVVLQPRS